MIFEDSSKFIGVEPLLDSPWSSLIRGLERQGRTNEGRGQELRGGLYLIYVIGLDVGARSGPDLRHQKPIQKMNLRH
jgi:hypothetical protein